MTTLIDNTFNQESWGASLKAYKETKNSLGYVQQPPHHETTYAHSRDERENKVDPVLQAFRDPTKEQNLRSWEDTHNIHGLNKSFDLQLTRESQFNVVNNQSKKEGLEGEVMVMVISQPPGNPHDSIRTNRAVFCIPTCHTTCGPPRLHASVSGTSRPEPPHLARLLT